MSDLRRLNVYGGTRGRSDLPLLLVYSFLRSPVACRPDVYRNNEGTSNLASLAHTFAVIVVFIVGVANLFPDKCERSQVRSDIFHRTYNTSRNPNLYRSHLCGYV